MLRSPPFAAILLTIALLALTACGSRSERVTSTPAPTRTPEPTFTVEVAAPIQTQANLIPTNTPDAPSLTSETTPLGQPAQVVEQPTSTPIPVPSGPVVNSTANLRGGPGTDFQVVGSVSTGDPLTIVATNQAGDWYELNSGAWIAAFLVNDAPGGLPVSQNVPSSPPTATPVPVQQEPPTATPIPVQANPPTVTPIPQPPQQNCDPSYPTVCIAPYPPDLDCDEIPFRRFQVNPPDPHGFDRDNDGIGCESG